MDSVDRWRGAASRLAGFALILATCGVAAACVRLHESALRWIPALTDDELPRRVTR